MLSRSRTVIAAALVIGFIAPAMAQQPMRHYLAYFKYTDAAVKAMTENPQDREAAARKLAEGFGGKLDVIYWMTSGPYDGFAVFEYPDDATAAASVALTRSSGNFQTNQSIPLLNAEEFKATMQKAKDVKASTAYTAPTQTK
jgi:uncharacterized protein with GYD domain